MSSSTARAAGPMVKDIDASALESLHAVNQRLTDGMEGDTVEDRASVLPGRRLKNGWKNSGCPWTYKLTPDRMLLPR